MCVLSSINKIMFLFAENLRLNLSPNKGKIASGSWNSSGNQARFSDTWNQVNYPQNSVFWNEKQRVSRWIFLFFKKRICFFFPLAIGDSHQRFWGWAAKRGIICGGHRVGRPNFGPSHRKSIWIHSDQDDPEVRIFQSALSSTSCAFFSGKLFFMIQETREKSFQISIISSWSKLDDPENKPSKNRWIIHLSEYINILIYYLV